MSAVLHRIEALPGDARYAVTFRVAGGGEQSAIAQVGADGIALAASSLPPDWDVTSAAHEAALRAVSALHEARAAERVAGTLTDVDGGWDVGLGNVVLDAAGVPECVAHGLLHEAGSGQWTCAECGARAVLA